MNPERLNEIIDYELFSDAVEILHKQAEQKTYNDINFFMVSDDVLKITPKKRKEFFDQYIKTGLALGVPSFVNTDLVHVPKKVASLREYRFLSKYGFAIYYSIGLYIAELVYENLKMIRANRKSLMVFSPVKVHRFESRGKQRWGIKDDYRGEYKKFNESVTKQCVKGAAILRIDIQNFYDDLSHSVLINHIDSLALTSKKMEKSFNEKIKYILKLYFSMLAGRDEGIPQGKRNLISSYIGDFYLSILDMQIERITAESGLILKGFVRYVDDIFVVVEANEANPELKKKMIDLETRISTWLVENLLLKLNSSKTKIAIFNQEQDATDFIKSDLKEVSFASDVVTSQTKFNKIMTTLGKFKYDSGSSFKLDFNNTDRELLKYIFTDSFMGCLKDPENLSKLEKTIQNIQFELISPVLGIVGKIVLAPIMGNDDKVCSIFESSIINEKIIINKKAAELLAYWYMSNKHRKRVSVIKNKMKAIVSKHRDTLIVDNLGKYLVCMFNDEILQGNGFDSSCVGKTISRSFLSTRNGFKNECVFEDFIVKYASSNVMNPQTTSQIIFLVHAVSNKNFENVINHAYSVFESLAKKCHGVKDNDNVNDIVKKIKSLPFNDELEIRKLADRRNVNSISHSGKHEKPSLISNKEEAYAYIKKVFLIINRYYF